MPGTAVFAFIRRSSHRQSSQAQRAFCMVFSLLITAQLASSQILPSANKDKDLSPRVQEQTFHSKALNRDMHYMIVVPADYDHSQQRYPVLYLLHGWAGDYTNWVKLTKLIEYSRRYPMIIVTPDAENSWYVNSATIPADRFEDYITNDLIREIDTRWRTIASSERRAIAGLSMGGYGSVLFGLKHPGLFAVVGSVSGAFDGPAGIEHLIPDLRESTDRAFGPMGSATRIDNNIYSLLIAESATTERNSLPYFFLECGSRDSLLPSNHKFAEELSSKNVPYEYHEYPGAHSWEFWDDSLPMMLDVIATRIVSEDIRRRGAPFVPVN
jgi:putative tributyrin esterase